ncbi:hypothetical protein ACFQZQ_13740 [Lysobacter koreensis]|uniref:DUF2007 domain-containing protein n=1 Tax=Lysobacter koreensis TaxID=266122 RepID=A0ABW2YV51_9GAMM
MRQVFSSPRLENVEAVAQLMREAGIEVRISNGRSYKGNRRGAFSYTDAEAPKPAVWVVQSEDQVKAREILRAAGLIDSTRPSDSFTTPTFRFEPQTQVRTSAQKRMFRIKMTLIGGIVLVAGMALVRGINTKPAPALALPPFDGTIGATLPPIARAVFAKEIAAIKMPMLCLAVDGKDASTELIGQLSTPAKPIVPASHCVRVADEERGSYHQHTGREAAFVEVHAFRPSAPDVGQIEFSAYHHRMWASYKTLEVRRIQDTWQVVRVIKHVAT